jgi:hypothetical protein
MIEYNPRGGRLCGFTACLDSNHFPFWKRSMKFIVEIPDREVFEAAEHPEGLACEIAEVIANEIFGFSSITVIPQQRMSSAR